MFEENFEPIETLLPLLSQKQVEIWVVFTEKLFSYTIVSLSAIISERLLYVQVATAITFKMHLEWYNSEEI